MVRNTLIVASLALLAVGVGGKAQADPYVSIFSARPDLASPKDTRPQDALQSQASKVEAPKSRLLVDFFGGRSSTSHTDFTQFGGGFAYANVATESHPWQLGTSFFTTNVSPDAAPDADFFGWNINGKFVVWNPAKANLPVVSLIGSFTKVHDNGEISDIVLAADQKLTKDIFATVNLGWSNFDSQFGGGDSDFRPGIGATWHPSGLKRFSLSADYVFKNDVDLEDTWGISALWAVDKTSSVQLSGGKHELFFGRYVAKFDWK